MGYSEYPEFDDFQQRLHPTESRTQSLTSIVLGTVVILYTLFKTAEFLGYPVGRWSYQFARMTTDVLRLRGASPEGSDSDTDDTTMQRSGGMLGSLFGLSPGSLLQKGVRGVAGAFSKGPNETPPGLGNISNSCYQNSVIQGLASLPSLRDYLSKMKSEHASLTNDSMNGALHEMLNKLVDPNNVGQHFWVRGKLKSMSVFQQQDAQEYYSKILDTMDEELKKASSNKRRTSVSWLEATKSLSGSPGPKGDSQSNNEKEKDSVLPLMEQPKIVPNPLDGLHAQRVGCTSCGYSEGLSLIPFNCITVSLGQDSAYDIRSCLDEYTALEYIRGVECAKCTLLKLKSTLTPLATGNPDSPYAAKLNAVQEVLDDEDFEDKTLIKTLNIPKKNWVKSTKSKQIVVARAPKALVLHVNRSSFNEMTGQSYKNTAGVSYPNVLDLGNWCLGNTPSGSQHPDMSLEEWPRDPKESMLVVPGNEPTTDSPFQYRLRAAVTHYGSHGSGHYVCYRTHLKPVTQKQESSERAEDKMADVEGALEEQWWRFSDDTVYAISESEAHQGNVFMLFYERIDKPIPTPSPLELGQPQTLAVPEYAPLPPVDVAFKSQLVIIDEAANIPLPQEDDLLDLTPPQFIPAHPASAEPTKSSVAEDVAPRTSSAQLPPHHNNGEMNTDSNTSTSNPNIASPPLTSTTTTPPTASSAHYPTPSPQTLISNTTVSEADTDTPTPTLPTTPKPTPIPQLSPHLMRTAGARRGQGGRKSLPLVSAT
ncbi:cysteine proteinase [Plenodomus tracheiphilus IPT5]|uniref:ubiquitinyl hydrolase 1 n=1 Tax=Plenodomus tracheiphilus IPT5 TaxID=1408161 RepID=A0A6A7B7Y9_9PLEO|nr:cysteine proteinase [Plenodomus tracheiphilus IPT5]